jgi:outer membrane protein assembly factor BamD
VRYWILLGLSALILIIGCGKKPRPILPVAAQFAQAKDLYDRGKYYKAQLDFENLIYTYPGNTVIDTAQFYLGMCNYMQKDYGLAAGEFKRLISAYPNSDFADDSQYYIAMSHYKMSPKYSLDQSETDQAIEEFHKLFSEYPTSEFIKDGRVKVAELETKLAKKSFMAGKLYLKMGYNDAAILYFAFVRDNYPSTDWAIQAFYYTGEAQYKMKKYAEAKDTMEKFLLGFSNHKLAPKAKEKLEQIAKETAKQEG